MKKLLKIFRRKENKFVLKDKIGNEIFLISQNKKSGEIEFVVNKPINITINDNFGISINGECDITTFGDMKIDTFLSKLFINSYLSKFIKDLPESKEKRKEAEKHNENYSNWLEENREKIIDFANQFLFKIKDK